MSIYKLPVIYKELSRKQRREVRQQYIKEQNYNCMYCGCNLFGEPHGDVLEKKIDLTLFPKGMLDYPIHLQHCHDTGLTEGAVHAYCNCVLWQYEGR